MARSKRTHALAFAMLTPALVAACGGGPSKAEALAVIQREVKEDGRCTLPVDVMAQVKMQHTSKGMCVPREKADKAQACLDALVAAGVTQRMPDAYMAEWPDEVASASLNMIPAYDRRSRNLLFKSCYALTGNLREGGFACADVKAEGIERITTDDSNRAEVHYTRKVTPMAQLEAVERSCGAVTRPAAEANVTLAKAKEGWTLVSENEVPAASSSVSTAAPKKN